MQNSTFFVVILPPSPPSCDLLCNQKVLIIDRRANTELFALREKKLLPAHFLPMKVKIHKIISVDLR